MAIKLPPFPRLNALFEIHAGLSRHVIQSAQLHALRNEIQELKKLIQDIQEKDEQKKPSLFDRLLGRK
jgi:hypothetical protein